MGGSNEHSLSDYQKAFINFENYLKQLYENPMNVEKKNKGFFVNLNGYENIKNKVFPSQNGQPILEQNGKVMEQNYIKFDPLKTESLNEVIENIKINHSYIIINETLFKYLCDPTQTPNNKIKYRITSEKKLAILFENGSQMLYNCKKYNIITKQSPLGYIGYIQNNNYNNTNNSSQPPQDNYENKIYEYLKIYIDNEKDIISKLNNSNESLYKGILVNNEWVEKWKIYSYYNQIYNLFQNNDINEKEIKRYIKQEQSTKNFNFNDLDYINKYVLEDISQIKEPINANKSFVLLNDNFVSKFTNYEEMEKNLINFILSYQKIKINSSDGNTLIFNTNNNIINFHNLNIVPIPTNLNNIQRNDIYKSQFLKHLIRFPLFKKELTPPYVSNNKQLNQVYLIKKEIINKLKELYGLKKLYDILGDNRLLDGINYRNCDDYYDKISQFLNVNRNNYINETKKKETSGAISFNDVENFFRIKNLDNKPSAIYIDGFEIIDKNFYFFLNQKFHNSIKMLEAFYTTIENEIFLIIIFSPSLYIYEIVRINPEGGNVIVVYLIELGFLNSNLAYNNNYLKNFVYLTIITNGLKPLINSKRIISTDGNISLTFHQIYNALKKNEEMTQNNIFGNKDNNSEKRILNIQFGQQIEVPRKNNSSPMELGINRNKDLFKSVWVNGNDIKNKIMNEQKSETSHNRYYLIDTKFFEILSNFINKDNNNAYYQTQIFNNMNASVQGKESNSEYKIKIKPIEIQRKIFTFPINFNVIDKVTYDIIIKSLAGKISLVNQFIKEINYIVVNGGFAMIPMENNFINDNNNLIYLYIDQVKGKLKTNEPFAILECNNYVERNNKFNLLQDQKLKNIFQNPAFFSNQLPAKLYLINDGINNSNKEKIFINAIPKFQSNSNNLNPNTFTSKNIPTLEHNVFVISERLKVMLLFAISQMYRNDNQLENIYLMNAKWFEQYEYKKIKQLVNQKSNEIARLPKITYDLNSLSGIIPIFKYQELKNFETKMNIPNQNSWGSNPEKIFKLIDKYIYLYTQFVIVNEKMFHLFKNYFCLDSSNANISHIHKKGEGDLIIFKDFNFSQNQSPVNDQNLIIFGIIDKEENIYKVNYLFDYKEKSILEKELPIFLQYNISGYIFKKTCLTPQNNKEIFSPIFGDDNNIIGNFYVYNEDCDYKKYDIYSPLLNKDRIKNVINLYYNEISIKNKIKNYKDEEFYLIKKEILDNIKEENNYDQLKNFFIGKIRNTQPSQKEIYLVIKSLNRNEFNDFNSELNKGNTSNDKPKNFQIEIDKIPNPNNPKEMCYIFKDFELVEKNLAKLLFNEKYPYILKCSFVGNDTIVFHYPNNKFNNKNYICVISKIDENNNFTNEYLLIYKQPNYIIQHFEKIKYQLNNFLQSLSFMKGTSPIVVNGYIEIGWVIQLVGQNNDLEYFPPIPLEITDINKDFQSKPLIGFENIGATCYMNATIQCLCNIKNFAAHFKYNNRLKTIVENDVNKEKLCSAFKRLIENSYPYELSQNFKNYKMKNPNKKIPIYHNLSKKSYAPENFKETISRMNPLFEGVAANDAKDLVNFLIMTLHEETNQAHPSQVDNNPGNMLMDQTNKMAMFNKFFQNFAQNYRSVISDLFYAMNCNITQCGYCQKISYNYQIYFFLIFPLEEVRKYKLQNNSQFMNNNFNSFNNNMANNIVDIYDCFAYDQKINFMGGENAMYCNYCRQTCGSSMCTLLTTGPKILIIILNRGKGIEFNVKINFYPEINLNNYIENKNLNWQYELFGVITHIGKSDMGGHFIAYCKEFWTNAWLKYNDALVSPVNDFKSEVIDFAMPYLLFYQIKE